MNIICCLCHIWCCLCFHQRIHSILQKCSTEAIYDAIWDAVNIMQLFMYEDFQFSALYVNSPYYIKGRLNLQLWEWIDKYFKIFQFYYLKIFLILQFERKKNPLFCELFLFVRLNIAWNNLRQKFPLWSLKNLRDCIRKIYTYKEFYEVHPTKKCELSYKACAWEHVQIILMKKRTNHKTKTYFTI